MAGNKLLIIPIEINATNNHYLKLLMTEMKESNIDFSSSIFKKYGRKITDF